MSHDAVHELRCPRVQLHDTDQVFPFRDTQSIHTELETELEQLLNQDETPSERCRERVSYWETTIFSQTFFQFFRKIKFLYPKP